MHKQSTGQLERFGYQQELRRALSFGDLVVYGLIFMVPIAPFGIFGSVFSASGGMIALAYTIGMLAMIFTAYSYSHMVQAFPMAGSVYNYAGRGISPAVGFLAGWIVLLDYVLVPGLLYLIASVGMHAAVPMIPVWGWIAVFVAINTGINYFGIRMTVMVTAVMLAAEIIVLGIFIAIGIWALTHGHGHGFTLDPFIRPDAFRWPVIFGAVSVAVLSFLGFDGISMLAEENKGGSRQIGRAMVAALALAGLLFIAQTWIASLLVTDPASLIANGDPDGTAFYDAARVAGGPWLATLTATSTAIAWGIANSLVAQVATSRLLFAMARDRQLPRFLARVSLRYNVPINAVTTVAVISLVLGIYMAHRNDGIALMSSLVNFGALSAFLLLHISVIWHHIIRHRGRRYIAHLVIPLIGSSIILAVVINANIAAQRLGLVWVISGLTILGGLYATGRKPTLSGHSILREGA